MRRCGIQIIKRGSGLMKDVPSLVVWEKTRRWIKTQINGWIVAHRDQKAHYTLGNQRNKNKYLHEIEDIQSLAMKCFFLFLLPDRVLDSGNTKKKDFFLFLSTQAINIKIWKNSWNFYWKRYSMLFICSGWVGACVLYLEL